MIIDSIENIHKYDNLHPNFRSLFNILEALNLDYLEVGHIELDGNYVFINIDDAEGRSCEKSPLEVHQRYIDIHIPIGSDEIIGYSDLSDVSLPKSAFNEECDVQFFADKPSHYTILRAKKDFAICFPEDAHAPAIAKGRFLKLVAKVSVEPNQEKPTL